MATRVRTKPVRLFAVDEIAPGLLARLLMRGRAEVFHQAGLEYVQTHRPGLAAVFRETHEALTAGDLDRLVCVFRVALAPQIDDLIGTMPI